MTKLCPWCGIGITDQATTCATHQSIDKGLTKPSGPEHALRGGRWVPDGRGVMRWEAMATSPEPIDPEKACGTCDAKPWDPCRKPNGDTIKPHAARIIARQCHCGDELKSPKVRVCAECEVHNKREKDRRYQAKRRSAA